MTLDCAGQGTGSLRARMMWTGESSRFQLEQSLCRLGRRKISAPSREFSVERAPDAVRLMQLSYCAAPLSARIDFDVIDGRAMSARALS
jgi:hypothetical protein